MPKVKVSMNLDEEIVEELSRIRAARGISVSYLVRKALRELLAREYGWKPRLAKQPATEEDAYYSDHEAPSNRSNP
jgi:metal-responsive CopG/Arc/MetJ family transcriptional regulator